MEGDTKRDWAKAAAFAVLAVEILLLVNWMALRP